MALVLVTTVGSPSANSYASVAEADAYHETRAFNSEWTGATEEQKNVVLAWATRLMDQEDFDGWATYPDGALRWPRLGMLDREGRPLSSDTIPTVVKWACAEWALYLLREDRTTDEGGLVQYGGKVGPITDPAYFVRKTMPSSVADMLRPHMQGGQGAGSGMGRVRRA